MAFFALVRVVVFASGFPFFHNIDEYRHVDRVLKYARGYWPGPSLPKVEPELADWMARWGTPEYTHTMDELPNEVAGPQPPEEMSAILRGFHDARLASFSAFTSIDAQQPPLYPMIASACYRLGRHLGLENVRALYFVRWMNGLALAALVVMSWAFLRRSHPDDSPLRLGVPLWIAAYPHDLFFGVSDDVLMPLLGAVAFFTMLHASARAPTRVGVAALGGVALALALLVKSTAILFMPVVAAIALACIWRGARSGGLAAELRAWAFAALVAAAPVGAWMAHNVALHGDPTATAQKQAQIRIARMPISMWMRHPLVNPATWPAFTAKMTRTFWSGEISWQKKRLYSPTLDVLYVATSGVAVSAAALASVRNRRERTGRRVEVAALVAVAAALAALAMTCIVYHYTGPKSSKNHFVASSRFVVWAVVPFAICYVRGIQVVCGALAARWRDAAFWGVLGAILVASIAGEIAITRPVFASQWNWYHLP